MPHALIINIAHDHQALKCLQEDRSILEIPQREFRDDTLMHAHLVTLEQIDQNRLNFPQVIDPDVRVNKDSHARARLRGAASAAGSLPPSAASCRPLSSSKLPPAFNAYQKLESAPNQRCLVIHSSEGSSARKRLVVNVNCQSHRTLQHQIGPIFTIRRCADQNLSTLTLIQRQSRATPSRDPAAGSSV